MIVLLLLHYYRCLTMLVEVCKAHVLTLIGILTMKIVPIEQKIAGLFCHQQISDLIN